MPPFFSKGAVAPRESYTSEAPLKTAAAPIAAPRAGLSSRDPARAFVRSLAAKAEYR